MGLLDKILGKDKQDAGTAGEEELRCSHSALAPHWDLPADMGKAHLATYTCESCGEKFSADEAEMLMDQAPPVMMAIAEEAEELEAAEAEEKLKTA